VRIQLKYFAEWAAEGGTNGVLPVGADGIPPLSGRACDRTPQSGRIFVNLGGTAEARILSFCPKRALDDVLRGQKLIVLVTLNNTKKGGIQ
jgi:hypothetical protein